MSEPKIAYIRCNNDLEIYVSKNGGATSVKVFPCPVCAKLDVKQLSEENATMKEHQRPRCPETEPPLDHKVVLVRRQPEDYNGTTFQGYRLASRYLGKWITTSGQSVWPVAWWPLPEQEKGDQ